MNAQRPDIPAPGQPRRHPWWGGPVLSRLALGAALGLALATPPLGQAKTFHCDSGDVPCLIAAITAANANGQKQNKIDLEAGTYPLTAVDNTTDGPNGLPSITSPLTITGAGAEATSIERQASAPFFRLLHVAATGRLTLTGLTLGGGALRFFSRDSGGGLFNNGGTVTITNSTLSSNRADHDGGGLFNNGGTVTITDSTLSGNRGREGGGIFNALTGMVTITDSILSGNGAMDGGGIVNDAGGTVTITHSTLADNLGSAIGGGIFNDTGGTVTITDSTIASNQSFDPGLGAGIDNFGGTVTILNSTIGGNHAAHIGAGGIESLGGTVTILNSTISGNRSSDGRGGGIINFGGAVTVQNTIVTLNTRLGGFRPSDCAGPVTSLDNNLIGTTTGCTITLQPGDLTGEPGLVAFTDDGTPGNGHFPLLPTSQAIDAGNDAACPPTDQLGQPRVGPCDIGAIEFQGGELVAAGRGHQGPQ